MQRSAQRSFRYATSSGHRRQYDDQTGSVPPSRRHHDIIRIGTSSWVEDETSRDYQFNTDGRYAASIWKWLKTFGLCSCPALQLKSSGCGCWYPSSPPPNSGQLAVGRTRRLGSSARFGDLPPSHSSSLVSQKQDDKSSVFYLVRVAMRTPE